MARTKVVERKPANLNVDQMRSGLKKIDRRIGDLEGFDVAVIRERWDPVVSALEKKVNSTLQEVLGHDTVEYHEYSIGRLDTLPIIIGGAPDSIQRVHAGYKTGIEREILKLKTLRDVLRERIEDSEVAAPQSRTPAKVRNANSRIFLVHGHDDGLKETVARCLTTLNMKPIILHEQVNQGRTIIEKFEIHADVDFAVVLFTPDDVGFPKGEAKKPRFRARQNVVLELGFFLGALGRQRVCVLHTGDIELPSDFSGVLYLPLDPGGAWRYMLAKEMKAAGLPIDLNLLG